VGEQRWVRVRESDRKFGVGGAQVARAWSSLGATFSFPPETAVLDCNLSRRVILIFNVRKVFVSSKNDVNTLSFRQGSK
jgi:hypothetical protein